MPEDARTLKRLLELATRLTATLDGDELLDLVLGAATELLDAETSSLLLYEPDTEELVFQVSTRDADLVAHRIPADAGVAGWALQHREPVVVADATTDERFFGGVDAATGSTTRTLLAVPLLVREQAIGVIEAVNKRSGSFDEADVEVAQALAGFAAVALDNAALHARLADAVVAARLSYRL